MKAKSTLLGLSIVLLVATSALAVPTHLTVRVKAKDTKFLGTSMGGALITLKDVHTGEVLTTGRTAGGTGDTARIMKTPITRGVAISDDTSAQFSATLDLDEPRLIEVTAYGPLANRQAANRVSATQWVVPGKHITEGDAWMLELPGFAVDVQAPPTHTQLQGIPQAVTLEANVTMMCGCPLTPGGVWDTEKMEVSALLRKDGKHVGVLPLEYAGVASQFSATWNVRETGVYEAIVYAYNPANGNTGVDSATFIVRP